MAAPILSAISHGFTANTILRRLVNNYPQYSNALLGAQAAGYTATQILRKFHNKKTGDNLPEEAFMTEHEKARKEDDKRKRNRALTTIGVLGTAGAGIAGAAHLIGRNAAIRPTQILPAIGRGVQQQQVRQQPTINIPNKQLPNHQKQLAHQQAGPISQNQPHRHPNSPKPPIAPAPQPKQTTVPTRLKDALAPQRNPLESIELVRNLKVEPRFLTILKNGYDAETSAELIKMVMPKDVKKIMEDRPGGIQAIVEDYTKYLSENQQQQPQKQPQQPIQQQLPVEQQQIPPQTEQPRSEEELVKNLAQAPNNPINETQVPQNIQPKTPPQPQLPIQQKPIAEQTPTKNLGMLPKGQIGEIKSIENGVAKIEVNGKTQSIKEGDLKKEPEDLESAVRYIVDSIPENMKSTAIESTIFVPLPEFTLMITKFYDGKYAWYRDVPEDVYNDISLGTYQPKGQGRTGIAEYKPGVADSRGAGFDQEIKINPKYSKENKGKTWGYADNKYSLTHSIQKILHKISKEKYDEQGNLIQPQKRKKSTT